MDSNIFKVFKYNNFNIIMIGRGSTRLPPHGPEGLCWPALWDSTAPVQPESGDGSGVVEDILPCSSAKEVIFICPQWLQTGFPDIAHNESPGETGVGLSQTSIEHLSGPAAICLMPWG